MDARYCLHPTITRDGIYPCGNCPVCRMKYRKQMAIRLYMEKSIEKPAYSYFITLTYNEENIPVVAGRKCFNKGHLRTFLDSVKHRLYGDGYSFRYFATCEYGEEGYRPHYHFIFLLYRKVGSLTFRKFARHEFLHTVVEPLWNKGFCYDGNVSLPSIMYCTAYALKDDEALERDWTGFEQGRPFRLFSLRPGLGLTDNCINWWTDYSYNGGDPRPGITVHLPKRAVSTGVPVGIKRKIKDTYPDLYEEIKYAAACAHQESVSRLLENATRFGAHRDYTGNHLDRKQDTSPDTEIKAFRKACRELAKRQRNPLK